ncbi:hypothetical protein NIES2130_36565 [Scytonema sp. HK-05]|nr:hypothetical protein NIES2130_36565 [Scytonema sp. HK-05]
MLHPLGAFNCKLWIAVVFGLAMKITRHGRVKILTTHEIQLAPQGGSHAFKSHAFKSIMEWAFCGF